MRNVVDIIATLSEIRRVLRPGARFVNLDVSKATNPLDQAALRYLFLRARSVDRRTHRRLARRIQLSAAIADELSRRRRPRPPAFVMPVFTTSVSSVSAWAQSQSTSESRHDRARSASERDLYALVEDFFRHRFQTDNPLITEAVRRMLAAGGKRLRPRITLLAAEAMGGDAARSSRACIIHGADPRRDSDPRRRRRRRANTPRGQRNGRRLRKSHQRTGRRLSLRLDIQERHRELDAPIPHILSATLADICDGEVLQLRALGNLDYRLMNTSRSSTRRPRRCSRASAECGAICRREGAGVACAARIRDSLRDRVPDDGRSARHDIGRSSARQARRQRSARTKVTIPLILRAEKGRRRVSHACRGVFRRGAGRAG